MSDEFSVKLEPKVGQIHEFSVIVGTKVVIDGADGTQERSYKGPVPTKGTRITIWTTGIPGAQYRVTVDLPGTAKDFAATYTLSSAEERISFEA